MSDGILNGLKESWNRLVESKGDDAFCYMLYVALKDEEPLVKLQKSLKLKGELVEAGKFHATVRYIKTTKDPKPFIEFLKTLELKNMEANFSGFEIYGKDKDTLVIELKSKSLHAWFKKINDWLVEHDYPKSDFPDYKPHISLTEKAGIEKPDWKDEYDQKINFSIHIVTDTTREEIFRSIC